MLINADLHIHSKYSMACSAKMDMPGIAGEAAKKGIDLVATGDCVHPGWLKEIKSASIDNETIVHGNTSFILSTEVEDEHRVHHLLILPSISKAEELAEAFSRFGDLSSDGRPSLRLNGEAIAQIAKDSEALIGPCHAFTPWTGMYAYHDSLKACYGDMVGYVSFLELGLSADTYQADRISELRDLSFLSNSDAHSPVSNKLAREFNRMDVPDMSFEGVKAAIMREKGHGITLNVGLYPQEGKYHETACITCFTHYSLHDSVATGWKCRSCGGRIKKGVCDRIGELADQMVHHPDHRPPYVHLMPLSEIIMMALGHASINTKGVNDAWNTLLLRFKNELDILLHIPPEDLGFVDRRIVGAIIAFREEKVILHPGGGGQYGRIELPSQECAEGATGVPCGKKQRSLFDF